MFIELYVRLTCFWKQHVRFIFDLATVECRYNAVQYNRHITDITAVMGAEYKSNGRAMVNLRGKTSAVGDFWRRFVTYAKIVFQKNSFASFW